MVHPAKQAKLSLWTRCRYQIVPTEQRLYYSFTPHELWRFVVLDSFDLSIQGWPAGTPEYEAALKLLQSKRSYHVRLASQLGMRLRHAVYVPESAQIQMRASCPE